MCGAGGVGGLEVGIGLGGGIGHGPGGLALHSQRKAINSAFSQLRITSQSMLFHECFQIYYFHILVVHF